MKSLFIVIAVSVLCGCAQNGYKQFYTPYLDARTLENVETLPDGGSPELISTDNFDRDVQILRSKRYVPIGHSHFNGALQDARNALEQAKIIGATVVLIGSEYTNTVTNTTNLYLPDTQTTTTTGTASGTTDYTSLQSGYLGSSSTIINYNERSTTNGTRTVPITSNTRRFDQSAVYFVKSNQEFRFGILFNDLTPEQRISIGRNTGVYINAVVEDTPAFYANIMPGDILTEVDGIMIRGTQNAMETLKAVPETQSQSYLSVIRNGELMVFNVEL